MANKDVNREHINASLEQLNPTQQQSARMWERLEAAMEAKKTLEQENNGKTVDMEQVRKNRTKKKGAAYRIMQVAAAVAVILVLGVTANSMTGGQVYAAIKEFLGFGQSRQGVAGNLADIQKRHTEIYAPEIYYCDGKTMVFGALRGLVVYDMEQGKIAATVDTQKIDCVYYNSDSKHTRVVISDGNLVVFNMAGEAMDGNYYVFDLSGVNGGELAVSESGNDAGRQQAYVEAWNVQEKNYTDTFELFCEDPVVGDIVMNNTDTESKYSERSIVWTDADGKEKNSFLYVQNGLYYYSIYDYETDFAETTLMNLEETIAGENGAQLPDSEIQDNQSLPATLPEYTYMGDNPAIAAIWEYRKADAMKSYGFGDQVVIPGYMVYKEIQTEDELLVFGNFYEYGFQQMGNVLECTSGGEMPACFHLKETAEGYEVISVDVTGDGAMYDAGIREFTKDYPEVYEMYFSGDPDACENAKKEYVSMYVSGNQLDIKYFKDYGWDPVPLFP